MNLIHNSAACALFLHFLTQAVIQLTPTPSRQWPTVSTDNSHNTMAVAVTLFISN
jgi:hypothetical protein